MGLVGRGGKLFLFVVLGVVFGVGEVSWFSCCCILLIVCCRVCTLFLSVCIDAAKDVNVSLASWTMSLLGDCWMMAEE